jgi:hypothetical protein
MSIRSAVRGAGCEVLRASYRVRRAKCAPGLVVAAACLLVAGVARAQTVSAAPQRHRVELTAGIAWFGGVALGAGSADLTRNQTPPSPYPIFKTDSSIASAIGFDGRIAFALTPRVAIEGGFSYAAPNLETRVSGDVESAPAVTATERLSQYGVDGSVVVHLTRWHLGAHAVPFVYGGAGYLRQAHERDILVATGHAFHAGGGVKYVFRRSQGFLKNLGVRGDARVSFRSGGVELDTDEPTHAVPIVSVGAFVRF